MVVQDILSILTTAGGKLIFAVIAYLIGRMIVDAILRTVKKLKALEKIEPTARTFILSSLRMLLYILLIITIIGILGVPMASVVAVLASAGVTVGLALQGALGNLAGGLMLLFFKPFAVGDFVQASGVWGMVREVTMFYTVITTSDNCRVTVPNGSLMNANIWNYSSEKNRRMDINFSVAKTEAPSKITELVRKVVEANPKVLNVPNAAPPYISVSGETNEATEYLVRVWYVGDDYRDICFGLRQEIAEALVQAGIQTPAVRIVN